MARRRRPTRARCSSSSPSAPIVRQPPPAPPAASTRRRWRRSPRRSGSSACSSRSWCGRRMRRQLRADRRRAPLAGGETCRSRRPSRPSSARADDVASLEQALVENLHRQDLNAAGGGGGLPAADRGLRPHPGAGGGPGRQEPVGGRRTRSGSSSCPPRLQRWSATASSPPGTPRRCSAHPTAPTRSTSPSGSSPRG